MHSSIRISLLILVGALCMVGSVAADCPVGNLDDNCKVDFNDVQILAGQWLADSNSIANLVGDDGVNFADFAVLAKNLGVVGQRMGELQVTISPQGAIDAGAKWRVDGGTWRNSGYTDTGLAAGVHKVEFKDIDGWAKPGYKIVEIYDGQTATENGEYKKPLVISEFMASNNSTLITEVDGQEVSPDWIEIYNPTDTTINLDGWYLANWNWGNPDPNLRDWQFPKDVNIEPGEFLVVFASNEDIRDANAPYLHTNFKLARNDECVAIVAPDGNTIVHQYTPYPQQLSDISYGLAQFAEMLVPTGADVRYHVPTSGDAGLDWTNPSFSDSGWEPGQTALGFDGTLCTAEFDNVDNAGEGPHLAGAQIGSDLRDRMLGINASLWTRIDFYVDDPDFYDCLALRMRYEDGYIAYLNGTEVVKKNFTGTPTWNSMADGDRPDEAACEFEAVNLNEFLDLLRPSPQKNVLAIQALNDSVSNEEFLILPELVVAKNDVVPQYFTTPTPGTFNISGAEGLVSEVWFSHERGFYDTEFQLTLSTEMEMDDDVQIRYTPDGSRPTATHGSTYYPGFPIQIDETTTIRAVAVKPGRLDSRVETHTYIFLDEVISQSHDGGAPDSHWPAPGPFDNRDNDQQLIDYGMDPDIVDDATWGPQLEEALTSIPTISLVTELDNLFDPNTGIYVNARQEGRSWERPASLELIYPTNPQGPGFPDLVEVPDNNGGVHWELPADMHGGFQIDAGVRIRGGFSRSGDNPKHAFRLFFRSAYGDAKLRYPLFGDEGDDVFDHLDFRCSQNYSWAFQGDNKNTMVREVFSRDLQGEMGRPYTRSRYYHVYINGHYWGLFQTQERSEASWGQSYMGGDKEHYDVVTSNWTAERRMVSTDGNRDALDRLYDETAAGFHNHQRYYRVQGLNTDGTRNPDFEKLLDVGNLIDFMIIEYYTGDSDGPGSRFGGIPNNTWGIFNRVNPDGWKWLHHDNEHTLGAGGADGSIENLVEPFTSAGGNRDYFNPHWLHEQLMFSNVDYRMQFADHVHRHFHNDGLMTLEKCRGRILNRAYQIDMAIIAESARWGDAKHSYWAHEKDEHWWPEIDRLLYETSDPWGRKTYLTHRTATVVGQFKDVDWYPDVRAPVFASMGEYIFMDNPNRSGTIYYTLDGNDPRVPAAQSMPGPLATLVTEDAAKWYLVPTVANGGNLLGNTPGEFDVTYYKANITVGNLATAESVISNPSYQSQVIAETSSVINYNNTNCPGHFAGDRPVAGGSGDLDDYVIEAAAIVQIPSSGSWTFGVHSDAGFSLELAGPGSFYMDYPSPRAPADSLAVFNVTTPGAYNLRLVFFERGGWSGVELFAAQGSHGSFNSNFHLIGDIVKGGLQAGEPKVWFTNYFDHSSWPSGTGGIGYETNPTSDPNYVGLFNIDVEGQMYGETSGNPNANTSCYIRIPFTVEADDLAGFNYMELKVRYDDGFIAYLNGGEVARRVFPEGAMPQWNSSTNPNQHDGAPAVNFESIDISDSINLLRAGDNILAFHGMNVSTTSSGFLICSQLVAHEGSPGDVNPDALIYYDPYFVLDKSTHVKARVLGGEMWSPLTEKIYSIGPVKANLRITELMYHPQETGDPNDPNEEFIELTNIGPGAINLNLVRFTNGVDFTFPNVPLAVGGRILVVKNQDAFEAEYGGGFNTAGEYFGSLNNGGERIELQDAIGRTILNFRYEDGWREITDGDGFSLTIIDASNSDPNNWDKEECWRASAKTGGSPGYDDGHLTYNPGTIVINEVLANSDVEVDDWLELHNTTGSQIDIGGWYLSDNDSNLMKYRIADGTTIGPYGYIVFEEYPNFGQTSTDPGCIIPFALSEKGEEVCLSSADVNGVLMGYREIEDFGASEPDVAFGLYTKSALAALASDPTDFAAMSQNTKDSANIYPPEVGPVVINEIMYNPGSGNQNEEYIELHNITLEDVNLFIPDVNDVNGVLPWKFTDGIDFTFPDDPADPNATIPADGYLLLAKNPDVFRAWYFAQYGYFPSFPVLGPYKGKLSNGGEDMELSKPGSKDETTGEIFYILVERVNYSDGDHPRAWYIDPWPPEPDGNYGEVLSVLSRINPTLYGNDPNNWQASAPSPGE